MNLIKSHKRIIVLPPQSEIPRRTIEQSMTLSLYIDSIYSSSEDLLLVYRGVNAILTQPTVFLQLLVIFFIPKDTTLTQCNSTFITVCLVTRTSFLCVIFGKSTYSHRCNLQSALWWTSTFLRVIPMGQVPIMNTYPGEIRTQISHFKHLYISSYSLFSFSWIKLNHKIVAVVILYTVSFSGAYRISFLKQKHTDSDEFAQICNLF